MHCLVVTYPAPKDVAAFKAYYESKHVPLAKQLPGLKSCSFAYPEPLGPSPAPFCIFQAFFEDGAAMVAALQSGTGAKVAADVPNYSPDGATLYHFAVGGVQSISAAAFRQAASRFATGVAVLTALDEQSEVCGMTANSFVAVSLSPPTVLVSVMPGRMHRAILTGGRYGVNVLPEGGGELSKHFAGRSNSPVTPDYEIVKGIPKLSGSVAFFACEVIRHIEVSDHTLFIAEVSNCDYCDDLPLVFFSSRYHLGPGVPADL